MQSNVFCGKLPSVFCMTHSVPPMKSQGMESSACPPQSRTTSRVLIDTLPIRKRRKSRNFIRSEFLIDTKLGARRAQFRPAHEPRVTSYEPRILIETSRLESPTSPTFSTKLVFLIEEKGVFSKSRWRSSGWVPAFQRRRASAKNATAIAAKMATLPHKGKAHGGEVPADVR